MFDSPADARVHLQKDFTPAQIETIVTALVPTLTFRPIAGGAIEVGGTRIGGTPDLPPDLAWPRRPVPANAEDIAKRGNADAAAEMRAHFKLEAPLAFLAQVDLEKAHALGPAGQALPDHGRLLVFYDLMAGPWDEGGDALRVIWDQAPRAALTAQDKPEVLAKAEAAYRKELAEVFARSKLKPPAKDVGTPYVARARAMALQAQWRIPRAFSLEAQARAALKALYEDGEDGDSALSELQDRYFDSHYAPKNSGHRNQLLGLPDPEQDDPRYEAAAYALTGSQHPGREVWEARKADLEREAASWRLLLQIDLSDLHQEPSEGTVYILIRDTDLNERRFERAVAVYQQT